MKQFLYGVLGTLYILIGVFIGLCAYGLSGLDDGNCSVWFGVGCGVLWPLAIPAALLMFVYANVVG